jgi:hypothetical protein
MEPGLDRHCYDNVIGGPGAFVIRRRTTTILLMRF